MDTVRTAPSRRALLAGLAATACLPWQVLSQETALRILYPFPAGGAGDAMARLIGEHLQKILGRPVIVENKTGAGGRIAVQAVKAAPADGATLLFAAAAQFTLQPHVIANLGYDPVADFAPISRIVTFDQALAVSGTVPVRSLRELAVWLSQNADRAAFGSPGAGTGAHFAGLEFARANGLDLRHVPYRGTPAAMPDVLAGRVPVFVASLAELIEHHRNGGIRILATTGAVRSPNLPEVPTLKESGVAMTAPGWFAVYTVAGVPAMERSRLEAALAAAVAMPDIQARITALGFQPADPSSRDLARVQRAEFNAWAELVKSHKFQPE